METADPAKFLAIRFVLAACALIIIALVIPSQRKFNANATQVMHAAVAGILLQAIYLGGVFAAIHLGIGAGLSSLIVGIQPVLTVILASMWLSESLSMQKIVGVAMGFVGVALVSLERGGTDGAMPLGGIVFCFAALLGITFGTLYQKRFCQSIDSHTNMIVQYIAASLFLLPIVLFQDAGSIDWTPKLVVVMLWLVFVLSIGTIFLLMWLIKVGEAGRVSTLFFLVPPVVAFEAWILFDEPLTPLVILGTLLTIIGVAIVSRTQNKV